MELPFAQDRTMNTSLRYSISPRLPPNIDESDGFKCSLQKRAAVAVLDWY